MKGERKKVVTKTESETPNESYKKKERKIEDQERERISEKLGSDMLPKIIR